jgi:hypothetical protein
MHFACFMVFTSRRFGLIEVNGADFVTSDFVISDGFRNQDLLEL